MIGNDKMYDNNKSIILFAIDLNEIQR